MKPVSVDEDRPSEQELKSYVFDHFWRFLGSPDSREPPPGQVHMVFSGGYDLAELPIIARKAVLYSKCARFFAGSIDRTLIGGPEDEFGVEPQILNWSSDFGEHLAILLPYLRAGCVQLQPQSSTRHDGGATTQGNYTGWLSVKLRRDYLREQLTETPAGASILLPHLAGVPAKELLKIREDHQEQFRDFQRTLSGLLEGRTGDDDKRLYELMQEVDHQVRAIDHEMRRIGRTRWLAAIGAAVVPFPLVLAMLPTLPLAEVVRAAIGALGTSSLITFLQNWHQVRESRGHVERNPFYVPWLLASRRTDSP